ncbi:MAG: hypothetical protein AB7F75_12385, partial [Planctomycetota bacterium]
YRRAYTPYAVMEFMTREAVQGRIDKDVLRAFMRICSLYPVGSWVVLSDQRVGKVVATNGEKYDKPIVKIFFDKDKRTSTRELVDLAAVEGLRVARTFDGSKLKIDAMEGF